MAASWKSSSSKPRAKNYFGGTNPGTQFHDAVPNHQATSSQSTKETAEQEGNPKMIEYPLDGGATGGKLRTPVSNLMLRCASRQPFSSLLSASSPPAVFQYRSAGFSVATFLQPLFVQGSAHRRSVRFIRSPLARHFTAQMHLVSSVTLAFLEPLPTKISSERCKKTPRTPAMVAAYQFREKAYNSSPPMVRAWRVQGMGRRRSLNAGTG